MEKHKNLDKDIQVVRGLDPELLELTKIPVIYEENEKLKLKKGTSLGVIDYNGKAGGNFEEGMQKILAAQKICVVVAQEYPELASAVGSLIEIAAAQDAKISLLEAELEKVRSERIVVAAQEKAREMSESMADKGYATGEQSFSIRIEEEESSESTSNYSSSSNSSSSLDVKAKIKGLAKLVAGLDLGVSIKEKDVEQVVDTSSASAKQSKRVNMIWKISGLVPPSDPKSFAVARRIREGHHLPTDDFAANAEFTRGWKAAVIVLGIGLIACLSLLISR